VLRRLPILLVLAFGAAGCFGGDGGEGSSISASQGDSLVLSQSDVGDQYNQFDGGDQQRADLSPPRDDPNRFDRQGGWKARFSRPGSRMTDGPLVVSSLADVFGSAGDAGKDFRLYERQLADFEANGGEQVDFDLGDEAAAVSYSQGLAPNAVRHYVIAWRRGNVTASLSLNGFKVTREQAFSLANKQDRRIRAAVAG
jgi:hypothetical protein